MNVLSSSSIKPTRTIHISNFKSKTRKLGFEKTKKMFILEVQRHFEDLIEFYLEHYTHQSAGNKFSYF